MGTPPVADRRPLGFGRRAEDATEPPGAKPVPSGAVALDDSSMARLLPERDPRGHKGKFGKLLVLAGSIDYAGAALLVCRAAGRSGAGLVTLAVPESLQPLFAAKVVEATTMALPEDDLEEVDPEPSLAKILDHEHDALVIGPGLRPALATNDLIRLLLTVPEDAASAPAVLDAEALRSLATADGWWTATTRPCVLTPHAGEFARLRAGSGHDPAEDGDLVGDDAARVAVAKAAAADWGQVVVLKGARTVVAAPDGTASVAPFENPALASGGTGDVLAGIIGALLAQGLSTGDAARLGVYLHGLAGESVRERLGDAGLLASDLPDPVALARKRLATIADRERTGSRLGFGARDRSRGAAPADGSDAEAAETAATPAVHRDAGR
jgi:ADP-dependent NAD(P)H-hydrate dehydratase / NAD(P)H-hydrate epimerase